MKTLVNNALTDIVVSEVSVVSIFYSSRYFTK